MKHSPSVPLPLKGVCSLPPKAASKFSAASKQTAPTRETEGGSSGDKERDSNPAVTGGKECLIVKLSFRERTACIYKLHCPGSPVIRVTLWSSFALFLGPKMGQPSGWREDHCYSLGLLKPQDETLHPSGPLGTAQSSQRN